MKISWFVASRGNLGQPWTRSLVSVTLSRIGLQCPAATDSECLVSATLSWIDLSSQLANLKPVEDY